MNNQKWVCVYKTNNSFNGDVVKGNLESAQIPCVIINKQDRSYLNFGLVELHVPEEYAQAAIQLLNQQSTTED
ncbi:MAG: DUF2007 domain-containing protein [Chitinophagaceae bacterium]